MRALYKDFIRGLLGNKGKFISVFFIILLGAAFFSGLRSTKGDMLLSAENYFDGCNLADINIVSTAGLTDDDIADLSALPQVEVAEGVYSLDVLSEGENRRAIKLISLSSSINVPSNIEGRLPQSADECVLDRLLLELGEYNIGDAITFSADSGLAHNTFTICGFADLPQYMDLNRGTGSVGNGEIDGFVLLMPEAFNLGYYTQINVLVSGAKELNSFESDYDGAISSAEAAIDEITSSACSRRYDELVAAVTSQPLPPQLIEELISRIPAPQWYVLNRSMVACCVNFENDADRIDSLSGLLPIVFFLVAALVSLTAMTRMVEEERQQIGTLKALGSSNSSVLARYLMYALIPTLFGSVAGVLIGEKLFPFVIMKAYSMLYEGLISYVMPYNLLQGGIAILASILSTGIAALAASINIVRERPAQIMRPEAPKPGKRVLLERITPVWNRLSFTQKSTVRNLFRNKKRFLMTIIGVAGCMGLVLVGLGLHDSIMVVVDKQFDELTHYQASVTVQDSCEAVSAEAEELGADSFIIYQKSVEVRGSGSPQTVSLSVPLSLEGIEQYFTFRGRTSGRAIEVGDGAIISEKTASSLGISVGDTVTFRDGDSAEVSLTITGIFENYIGHYIFISSSTYEELFGALPQYNVVLLSYPDASAEYEDGLGTRLMQMDGVQAISFTSALVEWANDTLSSLNTIVIIVLIMAALLAFVVLYNLNSINIAERKRELATLKVLGFYDKEVAMYVFKENILLTVIGIILGIGLGILLHQFVITAIEVDMIMFGRSIYWYSYIIGPLLTLAFSLIVNLIMFRSIKRINMIESLKSIE